MAKTTRIQWCDSTVNPTMGCDGCELWTSKRQTCYAGVLHRRFGGKSGFAPTFERVKLFPGRMQDASRWSDLSGLARGDKPWLDGMPRLIFVSDMSDALSESVEYDFLKDEVIDGVTSEAGQRHHWLWLTKRPRRMADFSSQLEMDWPTNLWAATSVTTQKSTSRIEDLLQVGNRETIRFVSVEPQWEPINLKKWLTKIDWVIQGGESGSAARPFHLEWAESLIEQCQVARVPYFLKQLGSNVCRKRKQVRYEQSHGGDWDEWPLNVRVRQLPEWVDV